MFPLMSHPGLCSQHPCGQPDTSLDGVGVGRGDRVEDLDRGFGPKTALVDVFRTGLEVAAGFGVKVDHAQVAVGCLSSHIPLID